MENSKFYYEEKKKPVAFELHSYSYLPSLKPANKIFVNLTLIILPSLKNQPTMLEIENIEGEDVTGVKHKSRREEWMGDAEEDET